MAAVAGICVAGDTAVNAPSPAALLRRHAAALLASKNKRRTTVAVDSAGAGADTDKEVRFVFPKHEHHEQQEHRGHGRDGVADGLTDRRRLSQGAISRRPSCPGRDATPANAQQWPSVESGRRVRVRRRATDPDAAATPTLGLGLISGVLGGAGGLPRLAAAQPSAAADSESRPVPLPGILKHAPPSLSVLGDTRPGSAPTESDMAVDSAEDARVRALALEYELRS